jgi:hypothetical protein
MRQQARRKHGCHGGRPSPYAERRIWSWEKLDRGHDV